MVVLAITATVVSFVAALAAIYNIKKSDMIELLAISSLIVSCVFPYLILRLLLGQYYVLATTIGIAGSIALLLFCSFLAKDRVS